MARSATAVFTSLHGTLLDDTMNPAPEAAALLRRLSACQVPVIPVTTLTFEEVSSMVDELPFCDTIIAEGGACVARLKSGNWEISASAPDSAAMLDVIREIEYLSGADLGLYSVMTEEEAFRVSGLRGPRLAVSQTRHCDEPFVIMRGREEEVIAAARRLGFAARRDGVLFRLGLGGDSGCAVEHVLNEVGAGTAIGIGHTAFDAEFLAHCDIAYIVPRHDGTIDAELARHVTHGRVTAYSGVAGWAEATDEVLKEARRRPASRAAQRGREQAATL